LQHEAAEAARLALTQLFTAYGEQFERVEVIKYWGQLLAYSNNDTQAMHGNMKKVHKSWAQVFCGEQRTLHLRSVVMFTKQLYRQYCYLGVKHGFRLL
jgi:hypothetical protein